MATFVMTGGGTGGHVYPALAVARELRARGHKVTFIGTRAGIESRLVPAAGLAIEWIEIVGIKRTGLRQGLRALTMLGAAVRRCAAILRTLRPAAVFSTGGFVAGPAVLAAIWRGVPIVALEPNAMPGLVTRRTARWVLRALVSFEETKRFFPSGRAELTGVPVRPEFFALHRQASGTYLRVLVTGGSQGSRTLNRAARESWPLLAGSGMEMVLQCGKNEANDLRAAFASSGMPGQVVDFINDMPSAFANADIVVCRAGAGAVAELKAAGMPSILAPFPYAADDHQSRNAQAMAQAGAAILIRDADMTGARLAGELQRLAGDPEALLNMGHAAKSLALPDAARRAADILEEVAKAC